MAYDECSIPGDTFPNFGWIIILSAIFKNRVRLIILSGLHHDLVKRWTLVLPYLSILCGTLAIVCEGESMISVNNSPSAPSFLRFNDYSIWRLSGLVGRAADL